MPPKVAKSMKVPLATGQKFYDIFHNELYPTTTEFRDSYVLPTTEKKGEIHLGFGLKLKSNNPSKDIRSLGNATIQFFSVLTLISIARINDRIVKAGLKEDIQVVSTIYDSIYFNCRDDIKIIKWLNDTLIPIMVEDFITPQPVKNKCNLDIGTNWANLVEIPIDATEQDIAEALTKARSS